MAPALEISNLHIQYKGFGNIAVQNLSLKVESGQIYGFLGSNGAGKTSTIKAILGILSPNKGSINIFGAPLSLNSKKRIGYMPEIANYYPYLTPKELLRFYGEIFTVPSAVLNKRIDELLELVNMSKFKNSLLKSFSKGMAQRISFAQALINDPDLFILDEPTTGLDPILKMNMRDALLDLKKKGKTIFFSSHELSEVEIISDRVAILKNGVLLKETEPKNLIDEKGVQVSLEKYFFDMVKEK